MPEASGHSGGLLGTFVRSVGCSIPALAQLKRKLMERNVAEEIAAKCAHTLRALWGSAAGAVQLEVNGIFQ